MNATSGLKRRVARVVGFLGPGLITGAADDDPAGIITDTQAGAQFRYGLAWTAVLQFPLLSALQLMVARIGLVTGRDVTRVLKDHYPRPVLWGACALLVVANTVTAGADLAGVAAAANLLVRVPARWIAGGITVLLALVLIFASYDLVARTMKLLTLALLGYVAAGILAMPRWSDVLRNTVIPAFSLDSGYMSMLVAVFGGTISPYMLVWQSAQEVEELRESDEKPLAERRRTDGRLLRHMRRDTLFGMGVSQIIEYFVFVAAATVIFPTGVRQIDTARQAATALHPIGGGLGEILFALGMIGSGLIAVPTLCGASAYAIAAAADWPSGIDKPVGEAKGFTATFTLGILVAGVIAVSAPNPMRLLVASQVLNGVLAPPLIAVILLIANNREILGEHTSGRLTNVLGIVTLVIMGSATLWLAGSWVVGRL
jgi:NRAMP (natural resistance-associated macrophage protein)-like metal ion transporter